MEEIARNVLETSLLIAACTMLVRYWDREEKITEALPCTPLVGGLAILLSVGGMLVSLVVLIWV